MLAIEVNHKWDACSSKNSTQAPVHPHIKYPAPTPTTTPREVITLTPNILKMKVLSTNSYDIFDSPNEGPGRCFMAKGPKVTHHYKKNTLP